MSHCSHFGSSQSMQECIASCRHSFATRMAGHEIQPSVVNNVQQTVVLAVLNNLHSRSVPSGFDLANRRSSPKATGFELASMARPEPPQAELNSLQLLQETRAVLNLVQALLHTLHHLQEPRAVLNSVMSLGAQVNNFWTASVQHRRAYPRSGSETPPS